jgi:hypothetical protein
LSDGWGTLILAHPIMVLLLTAWLACFSVFAFQAESSKPLRGSTFVFARDRLGFYGPALLPANCALATALRKLRHVGGSGKLAIPL